jgi:hypothetical protein
VVPLQIFAAKNHDDIASPGLRIRALFLRVKNIVERQAVIKRPSLAIVVLSIKVPGLPGDFVR